MIYLQLFFEFFKAGLFAIGGGLATIPFLTDIGQRTGWFTSGELANMIAISESTPGPMGVNMATYVGFHTGGIAGGVIATLGLVCPSILVILVIAGFLKKFRESRGVDAVFYGIRPASTALIAAALAEVCSIALLNLSAFQTGGAAALFQWKGDRPGGGHLRVPPGEAPEKTPPHRVHRRLGGDRRGLPVLKKSRAVCAARDFLVYSAGEATRKRKSLPPSSSGKAPYMEKLYRKRSAISTP